MVGLSLKWPDPSKASKSQTRSVAVQTTILNRQSHPLIMDHAAPWAAHWEPMGAHGAPMGCHCGPMGLMGKPFGDQWGANGVPWGPMGHTISTNFCSTAQAALMLEMLKMFQEVTQTNDNTIDFLKKNIMKGLSL